MFSPDPVRVPLPQDGPTLDALLLEIPCVTAVFVLDMGQGQQPYLARTSNLRRRMRRLLRAAEGPSLMLNLRGIARELRYWEAGNGLGVALLLWEQARTRYPARYRRMLRLRIPYYVSLLTENRFPRAVVTSNPAREDAAFGPFASRTEADRFGGQALDLFQMRRCEEELEPRTSHPGCIYGEMAMCLRPCQAVASEDAYRRESRNFLTMLATRGESLRTRLESERNAASEALDFEAAAKAHKRLTRLEECFPRNGRLERLLSHFHGIAVAPGRFRGEAVIWRVWAGHLQPPRAVAVNELSAKELAGLLVRGSEGRIVHREETKQELLAVLLKWLRSSWRDGEWIAIEEGERLPIRRLRNAIRRAARPAGGEASMPDDARGNAVGEESEARDETRNV